MLLSGDTGLQIGSAVLDDLVGISWLLPVAEHCKLSAC